MAFDRFVARYQPEGTDDPTSSEQQSKIATSHLSALRSAYLHKVLQGTHIIGSLYNRQCFIRLSKKGLELCEPIGPVSIGDIQSILQLICPNFPLGVVKNAFTPARKLTPGKDVKTLRHRLDRAHISGKFPMIPEEHLQGAINSLEGDQCNFGDLLRSLCGNDDLQHQLTKECSKDLLPSWALTENISSCPACDPA